MPLSHAILLACVLAGHMLIGQTPQQQTRNLHAFAKAYGYLKYFHPSDEAAALDWNRFAAHGAARAKMAKDDEELKTLLRELFAPIAPQAVIHAKDETPALPSSTFLQDRVVAWQHLGNGLDTERPGNPVYQSVRVNRPKPHETPFGSVNCKLEAAPYAGRRIRFSAEVRAEVPEGLGSARIWLRVGRPGGAPGFFGNLGDRPVVDPNWKRQEVIGTVAPDAKEIALGLMLVGRGKAWFDKASLSVEQDGVWVEIPLPDPDFEATKAGNSPRGWIIGSEDHVCEVVDGGAASGKQCLTLQFKEGRLADPLFAELPKAGEVLRKELIPGLILSFPLTLPAENRTEASPALESLKQVLAKQAPASADQEAVRLGNLVITWNQFQHFYPYFDVVKVDWERALDEALEAGQKDRTALEHWVTLKKLVAKIQDGHGVVFFKDPQAGDLPARFDWIEDRLVVTAVPEGSSFQRGDVVLGVDGCSGAELLKMAEEQVSGSEALRRHRALNILGFGAIGEVAKVLVQRGEAQVALNVKRVKPFGSLFFKELWEFKREPFQDLGNGIYYFNWFGLEKTRFAELLPILAKARGIIVDQRPVGFAKDPINLLELIPHLAKEPFVSAHFLIPQLIYPDREKLNFSERRWRPTAPQEPHITARIVVINAPNVVSQGETIMGIFEHHHLAEFVGEPTAGCNGEANYTLLPGGFRIMWTGMKVLKHDGSQHHLVGIQPTHPVRRTLKAVIEGRDEYLEKAIALLK